MRPTSLTLALLLILLLVGCKREKEKEGDSGKGEAPPIDALPFPSPPPLPPAPTLPPETVERIEALIAAFAGEDHERRFRACDELVKIGKPAVFFLLRALKHRNGTVSVHAANALKEMGKRPDLRPHLQEVAIPHLASTLRDGDCYVPVVSNQALGTIGSEGAVEALIEALRDFRSRVRAFASISLKELTGRDHGEDYEAWRTWYRNRRER